MAIILVGRLGFLVGCCACKPVYLRLLDPIIAFEVCFVGAVAMSVKEVDGESGV